MRIPREKGEQNQEKWTPMKRKSQKTDQGWLSIPVVATVEEPPPGTELAQSVPFGIVVSF